MGRILVVLFSLLSCASFAATPGNAPILTIAAPGQQTQALSIPLSCLSTGGCPTQVFSLYVGGFSMTGSAVYPFWKNGALYQVTSGKSAYCVNGTAAASTGSLSYQLVSSTATFANAGSLTGGVYQAGASANDVDLVGANANVPGAVPGSYVFAASTWPGIQSGGNLVFFVHLDCFEQ